jgi:predicted metalloprotease with PDZ domain
MVNTRNRMGGYTGRSFFQVVLHNGAIDMLDIGNSSDDVDIVGASCAKMIKDNFLQPAPAPQASASISPAAAMAMLQQMVTANEARGMESAKAGMANGGYGFSAVATPYGVSIMAVAPGSRAATAGLKAGQDVLEINGKSTVGLTNDQFIALIHSKPAQGFDLKISNAPSVHLPPL